MIEVVWNGEVRSIGQWRAGVELGVAGFALLRPTLTWLLWKGGARAGCEARPRRKLRRRADGGGGGCFRVVGLGVGGGNIQQVCVCVFKYGSIVRRTVEQLLATATAAAGAEVRRRRSRPPRRDDEAATAAASIAVSVWLSSW